MASDLTQWLTTRNRNLARAGEGIISARKVLDQLEEFLAHGSAGKALDIGEIVDTVHALRGHVDSILIGLVEASSVPCNGERGDE